MAKQILQLQITYRNIKPSNNENIWWPIFFDSYNNSMIAYSHRGIILYYLFFMCRSKKSDEIYSACVSFLYAWWLYNVLSVDFTSNQPPNIIKFPFSPQRKYPWRKEYNHRCCGIIKNSVHQPQMILGVNRWMMINLKIIIFVFIKQISLCSKTRATQHIFGRNKHTQPYAQIYTHTHTRIFLSIISRQKKVWRR